MKGQHDLEQPNRGPVTMEDLFNIGKQGEKKKNKEEFGILSIFCWISLGK